MGPGFQADQQFLGVQLSLLDQMFQEGPVCLMVLQYRGFLLFQVAQRFLLPRLFQEAQVCQLYPQCLVVHPVQ